MEFLVTFTGLVLAAFCTTFTVAVTLGLVVERRRLTGVALEGDSSDSDEYMAAPFFTFNGCFTGGVFFSSGFFGFTLEATGFPRFALSFSDLLLLFCDEEVASESENEESLPDELDEEDEELELLVEDDSELLALC